LGHPCFTFSTQGKVELIRSYFDGLSDVQARRFEALGSLYREWNARVNIISRHDLPFLYERHVLHSLSIAVIAGFAPGAQILDIGTGGGFPGIPLAIFFPQSEFLLLDATGKKIRVVQEIVDALGLENVKTLHGRAEDLRLSGFDFTISRAVASLGTLWTWSRKLLKKGPSSSLANGLICLKGGELTREIKASRCQPHVYEVYSMFPREYFKEKYLLHVPFDKNP
jgi:16S rRNA (guanine527-N7)-methyltransferase